MKLGISINSRYDVNDPREGARWMLERAAAAAEAGLDSLFFGDHHVTTGPYYQNTPILARALADWQSGAAGALYLLPFRHPILLAEEIATLATLVPDRFVMQCALGYGDREFAAFGINPRHRPSRFEQSLEIMRRLWDGQTVTYDGRWQGQEAHISPTPPQPIEVWIGASAEPAIERAARLGDGWLAAPGLSLEQAKRSLDHYHACCARHGRTPGVAAIRRDIYVGESEDEANASGGKVIAAGYRGFAPGAAIVGDADAVAEAFGELAGIGFSDVIVRNLVNEQQKALASITRLQAVRMKVRES